MPSQALVKLPRCTSVMVCNHSNARLVRAFVSRCCKVWMRSGALSTDCPIGCTVHMSSESAGLQVCCACLMAGSKQKLLLASEEVRDDIMVADFSNGMTVA